MTLKTYATNKQRKRANANVKLVKLHARSKTSTNIHEKKVIRIMFWYNSNKYSSFFLVFLWGFSE